MAGKDRPLHHGHAPPWRKKSPRSRSFFLLSPRIFLVVLSSRSYDDVSDDITLLFMTWNSTAVLNSCTVQLYSTMDSMGTRARGWSSSRNSSFRSRANARLNLVSESTWLNADSQQAYNIQLLLWRSALSFQIGLCF